MARLRLDHNRLGDFIVLLLLDKMMNEDFLTVNEEFNEFVESLKQKGLRANAFAYYMDTDPNMRRDYKRFKRVFDVEEGEKGETGFIDLFPDKWLSESNNDLDQAFIERIVEETIKQLTGKEKPDRKKLNALTESVKEKLLEGEE